MAKGRTGHTASILSDGRVLVVGGHRGGFVSGPPLRSAEIWDPDTNEISPAGPLTHARAHHTATSLPGGRILIVGSTDSPVPAELWDPATGTFGPAGSLAEMRVMHTATLLRDGRVLVVGGWSVEDNDGLASAEMWDPATRSFAPVGSLAGPRREHTTTLLADGRVLVVGGRDDYVLRSALSREPGQQ